MTHLSCVQNRQTGKAEVFQLSAWDPRHQHGKVPAPGWESRNSIRVLFSRLAAGGTASEILCSTPEPACVTGCCHCSNVVCWIKAASQVSLDGWTFVCSAEDWHVHSSWQIALVSFGSHALLLFPSKQENSAVIFCGMMTGSSADRKAPRTACLSGEDSGKINLPTVRKFLLSRSWMAWNRYNQPGIRDWEWNKLSTKGWTINVALPAAALKHYFTAIAAPGCTNAL